MPKPKVASKTKAANAAARELGYRSAFDCDLRGSSDHKEIVQDAFTKKTPNGRSKGGGVLANKLVELRAQKTSYELGLLAIVDFVNKSNGEIFDLPDAHTKIILGEESAICFQPYPDIDRFYYEN